MSDKHPTNHQPLCRINAALHATHDRIVAMINDERIAPDESKVIQAPKAGTQRPTLNIQFSREEALTRGGCSRLFRPWRT